MINLLAVGLVILGVLIGGVGSIFIKKGAAAFTIQKFWLLFKNKFLFWGLILYAFSIVPYLLALRMEEVSVLYPMVSLSYIWVMLLSVKFLRERMNTYKWLGLLAIIVGVVLIGLGS